MTTWTSDGDSLSRLTTNQTGQSNFTAFDASQPVVFIGIIRTSSYATSLREELCVSFGQIPSWPVRLAIDSRLVTNITLCHMLTCREVTMSSFGVAFLNLSRPIGRIKLVGGLGLCHFICRISVSTLPTIMGYVHGFTPDDVSVLARLQCLYFSGMRLAIDYRQTYILLNIRADLALRV